MATQQYQSTVLAYNRYGTSIQLKVRKWKAV